MVYLYFIILFTIIKTIKNAISLSLLMGNNILSAIYNIAKFKNNNLKEYASEYLIRINAVGEQLEFFFKDAIANSLKESQKDKENNYSQVFSWLGSQNNPPDIIINKGDAFEIKKIENPGSSLALNSSPPKDVLHSDDSRVTSACRNCEENWKEKDIFYVIGHTKNNKIKYLFIIQGKCYSAGKEYYDRLHNPLKDEINSVLKEKGYAEEKTVELGKVKKVDPLGRTLLRIRGMWSIENPLKSFSEFCKLNGKEFSLFAILEKEKYNSYPKEDIDKLENSKEISIEDIKIKDPNNPVKLIDTKLIKFNF